MHPKDLYREMLRIRLIEREISNRYEEQQMKTPIHLSIGQEAIAVGVCSVLEKGDFVCSNHRCHGHYLAKGGDLKAMIAELHGRETGCSRGRGGSMHLIDLSVGFHGSSAIVGGGIPIATGLALSQKMKKSHGVTVTFFGDGAADEGVLDESVRIATNWRLPVIFVLEWNGLAVNSPAEKRHPSAGIPTLLRNVCELINEDGTCVDTVQAAAELAIERGRAGYPTFLKFDCDRWAEHVGPTITHAGRCPLTRFLQEHPGSFTDQELFELRCEIETEIEEAFQYALSSPEPDPEEVERYAYRDQD